MPRSIEARKITSHVCWRRSSERAEPSCRMPAWIPSLSIETEFEVDSISYSEEFSCDLRLVVQLVQADHV